MLVKVVYYASSTALLALPKISPGAYIFQKALFEGLIFGGAYLRSQICVYKSIGLAS